MDSPRICVSGRETMCSRLFFFVFFGKIRFSGEVLKNEFRFKKPYFLDEIYCFYQKMPTNIYNN